MHSTELQLQVIREEAALQNYLRLLKLDLTLYLQDLKMTPEKSSKTHSTMKLLNYAQKSNSYRLNCASRTKKSTCTLNMFPMQRQNSNSNNSHLNSISLHWRLKLNSPNSMDTLPLLMQVLLVLLDLLHSINLLQHRILCTHLLQLLFYPLRHQLWTDLLQEETLRYNNLKLINHRICNGRISNYSWRSLPLRNNIRVWSNS